jgi:hypothetical protein
MWPTLEDPSREPLRNGTHSLFRMARCTCHGGGFLLDTHNGGQCCLIFFFSPFTWFIESALVPCTLSADCAGELACEEGCGDNGTAALPLFRFFFFLALVSVWSLSSLSPSSSSPSEILLLLLFFLGEEVLALVRLRLDLGTRPKVLTTPAQHLTRAAMEF